MNPRAEVLLWAHRIVGRSGAAPHQLLEVSGEAELEEITAAFHKIARMAHPDLHRTMLTPDELEAVTTAYSRVAAAYQELRTQRMKTTKMRPIRDDIDPQTIRGVAPFVRPTAPTPPRAAPAVATPRTETVKLAPGPPKPREDAPVALPDSSPKPVAATAATMMSAKALVYYRKAELCLRRGALRDAMLQIKMAIAADPQSAFLRTALTEVEAEVRKTP